MAVVNPTQEIKHIKLSDLILWSENPRDPIGEGASVNDVIKIAIEDKKGKWNLEKLCKEMGDYYDTSEIPTVVEKGKKYIVYDGNRRVALIKYLQNPMGYPNLTNSFKGFEASKHFKNLSEIPCNVCDKETALQNVERKHMKGGSWKILEREYFYIKHRAIDGEEIKKSIFLLLEEATNLISKNKELNKYFFKDEILTEANMNSIGFSFRDNKIYSVYSDKNAKALLTLLAGAMIKKKFTTMNRFPAGALGDRLLSEYPELRKVKTVTANRDKLKICSNLEIGEIAHIVEKAPVLTGIEPTEKLDKPTPPSTDPIIKMFPDTLVLRDGNVNDLYLDIKRMDEIYQNHRNKKAFTPNFPRLLRISLRLLVEIATGFHGSEKIKDYIDDYYKDAEELLSQEHRASLSMNGIKKSEMTKLLQTGAHNYIDSTNYGVVCAMSIIVGAMLQISHKKM